MKKTLFVIAALALFAGALTISAALAQTATTATDTITMTTSVTPSPSPTATGQDTRSQIQKLQDILKELRDKVRLNISSTPDRFRSVIETREGDIRERIETRIENGVERTKVEERVRQALKNRAKPGKAKFDIEELGNGTNRVQVKNAMITEIIQPDTIKAKAFGVTATIKLSANTRIIREFGGPSNLNEFAVGDYVNITGTQSDADPLIISAQIVRNSSITRASAQQRTVCAQVLTAAKNTATGECKTFPTPCQVPSGWVIGCNNTTTTTAATSTR